jgi:hypothetical protein
MSKCCELLESLQNCNPKAFAQIVLRHWDVLNIPLVEFDAQYTILRLACRYQDIDAVQILLRAGADPKIQYNYSTREPCAHYVYDNQGIMIENIPVADLDDSYTPRTCAEHVRADAKTYGMEVLSDDIQTCLDAIADPPEPMSRGEFAKEYNCDEATIPCHCTPSRELSVEKVDDFIVVYTKRHEIPTDKAIAFGEEFSRELQE